MTHDVQERVRRVIRAKAIIGEVKIESDGESVPLEYVLIRGFSAMGWKLPATAAGDMLEAIAVSIGKMP
jgi:hypothetical protein